MSLPAAVFQPAGVAHPPTYWHGGPEIDGDLLLPAATTGKYSTSRGENTEFVYFTTGGAWALIYARAAGLVTEQNGWLYEVEPVGFVEPDPRMPGVALRSRTARILRRHEITPEHVDCWPAMRTAAQLFLLVAQARALERQFEAGALVRQYTGRGGP